MFKRRDKRGTGRLIRDSFYPPGGWGRAFNYVYHRLRRLPDPPHRIARGIAAGMFISCSPFFGLHFLLAAAVAWLARGNILAAILSTFFGNPITFPFIATAALTSGSWILGRETRVNLGDLSRAFREAGAEVWWNARSLFTAGQAHWGGLEQFWHEIFLPYMVGGLLNGAVLALVVYMLAHPVIDAYQRRRSRALQRRLQARLKASGGTTAAE